MSNTLPAQEANLPKDRAVNLSVEHAWALALPAILDEYNGTAHDTLEVDHASLGNRGYWREFLVPQWDIHSKTDLLDTLQWLENIGQTQDFNRLVRKIHANPDADAAQLAKIYGLDERDGAGLHYLKALTVPLSLDMIKGYDLGRYVEMARWGYQAGYLDNEEAWDAILSVLPEIKRRFDSWEEFGKSFLVGRLFWLEMTGASNAAKLKTRKCYDNLMQPDGLWQIIPWEPIEANDAPLQLMIGKMYLAGRGVEANRELGLEWIEKAAAKNYSAADDILQELKSDKGEAADFLYPQSDSP
jgi:hypothetical protein